MDKKIDIIGDSVIFMGYEVAKIKNKNKYPSIIGDFIDIMEKADLLNKTDDLADDLDDLADDLDDLADNFNMIINRLQNFVDKLKGEE